MLICGNPVVRLLTVAVLLAGYSWQVSAQPVLPPPAETLVNPIEKPIWIDEPAGIPAQTQIIVRFSSSGPVENLVETAENGSAGLLIDDGSGGYNVIQQLTVIEGSNSFHLSNTGFTDSSITLATPIAVTGETKLFFESWLRFATTGQFAKVQISSDGGISWPDTVYSLMGASAETQPAASLVEIDLSAYAGQTIRIRFFYDYTGIGLFELEGFESIVGWFFDNIQVGTSFTKRQYAIGDPTGKEQLYLELINRARADAAAEAQRLKNTTDPDVLSAVNFFNTDLNEMVNQFATLPQTVQPLSFNEKLIAAARLHSQDMFDNTFQDHISSPSPPSPNVSGDNPGARATRQGYMGSAFGENVFAFADSVWHGHAGFNIDWGNGDFGIQNPPGHRLTIYNRYFDVIDNVVKEVEYKEIGIGVMLGNKTGTDWTKVADNAQNTTTSVGPQLVTQAFGKPEADTCFITGVIFDDADGDKFYDEGEGVGGVRVDVEGSVYYAISTASGGYSVPVPADGQYTVTFQADHYADFSDTVTVTGLENRKVDWRRLRVTVSDASNSQSDLVTINFTPENQSPGATFKLLTATSPGGPYSEVPGATPTGPLNEVYTFTYQRSQGEEVFFRVEMTD